ncbi:MAG: hypothetical protein IPG07_12185 [Crocinitomicaceae bacterium]|nr:hypothetical protein [Crocinitomicaceae bacterium]
MTQEIKTTSLNPVFNAEEAKFYLDQLNLLYVAFTRPEVALFISANPKVSPSPASLWLNGFFKSQNWNALASGAVYNGEFEMPELEQKKMAPGFLIDADFPKLGRPQMSFKSAENWNVDELDEKDCLVQSAFDFIQNHNSCRS